MRAILAAVASSALLSTSVLGAQVFSSQSVWLQSDSGSLDYSLGAGASAPTPPLVRSLHSASLGGSTFSSATFGAAATSANVQANSFGLSSLTSSDYLGLADGSGSFRRSAAVFWAGSQDNFTPVQDALITITSHFDTIVSLNSVADIAMYESVLAQFQSAYGIDYETELTLGEVSASSSMFARLITDVSSAQNTYMQALSSIRASSTIIGDMTPGSGAVSTIYNYSAASRQAFVDRYSYSPFSSSRTNLTPFSSIANVTSYQFTSTYSFDAVVKAGVGYTIQIESSCTAQLWGLSAFIAGNSATCGPTAGLWYGVSNVRNLDGSPLTGFAMTGASGFDYIAGTTTVPGTVPEPASWALMIAGFGMTGAAMRRRKFAAA